LVLGISDPETPEVTLRLRRQNAKLKTQPKQGAAILFEGIAREFKKDPFMLTFEVERVGGLDFESPQ